METTGTKKMSLLLTALVAGSVALSLFFPAGRFTAEGENNFIKKLKMKLEAFNKHLPEEKIYLQFDKPFYQPGDDIWFAGYLREGETLFPSEQSGIMHVELISPKGAVDQKLALIVKKGKVSGDFSLDKEIAGGLYKVRAYTSWMKNEGEENLFEKDLQVQQVILPSVRMKFDFNKKAYGAGDEVRATLSLINKENRTIADQKITYQLSLDGKKILEQSMTTDVDGVADLVFQLPARLEKNDGILNVLFDYNGSTESISRAVPIVLNKLSLELLPEGGNLLAGFENNLAFRALNEFGKAADMEGILVDEQGRTVSAFSSLHMGMGVVKFTPEPRKKYFAKITKPAGIEEVFSVPEAWENGYSMQIENCSQVEIAVNINTTETELLPLVVMMHGKIVYSTVVNSLPGLNKILIPTRTLPIGVAQVTLFDAKAIGRCERLVFVNKHKQMHVTVETDKNKYLPREKVKVNIKVTDERGLPMPAQLSMAVVNDQLLAFADDRSGNIISQLLLETDLKQKVEEPSFYFNASEKNADKALDNLLLTAGWRRFTWEMILENEFPPLNFLMEKTIVAGQILDGASGKPLPNADITFHTYQHVYSDPDGRFSISSIDLSKEQTVTVAAAGYMSQSLRVGEYDQQIQISLYNKNTYFLRSQATVKRAIPQFAAMNQAPAVAREKDMVLAEEGAVELLREEEPEKMDMEAKAEPMDEAAQEDEGTAFKISDDRFVVDKKKKMLINLPRYYRSREFSAPTYTANEKIEKRSDFRNTIYWNPTIEVGYSGKTSIEFFTSDDITSFRAVVEGLGKDGSPAHAETTLFTQLPFSMSVKVPIEVVAGDTISLPLLLQNNTNGPLGGALTVSASPAFELIESLSPVQTIMPGKVTGVMLKYLVHNVPGDAQLDLSFHACGLSDAFSQKVKIISEGFPVKNSFSSQESEKEFSFRIHNSVKGSLEASFTAFPNVVSDLMTGVEGILQEPYGCFEQTSCTAYPNAMVLDYLKSMNSTDNRTLARATALLDRGYKRLNTFESPGRGYEWFGANPAHEGLTAYGIMEFVDMKKAGQEIDGEMLDRTARWLLSHRDGKGGFEREKRALHDFGRISDDVLNGYIVYAMSEAGYTDLSREFELANKRAVEKNDAYLLAMAANSSFNLKKNDKAEELLSLLLKKQAKDGSLEGASHSITYSEGQSLKIETTALGILALLKSSAKNEQDLDKAIRFLVSSRSGSGVFSSTQGTILALKALTAYAKYNKKIAEDGIIELYVDDKKVATQVYKAGQREPVAVKGLEKFIKGEGSHTIKVKFPGVKKPLPYSVTVNYNTTLPESDADCKLGLQVKAHRSSCFLGETIRLTATLKNKSDGEVPSSIAIIGIPAGLSVQPWQLKQLQEKGVFDYYEIKNNGLALYYRGLGANAEKIIALDLKAETSGHFSAPASCAYLYYNNELKQWCGLEKLRINKQ